MRVRVRFFLPMLGVLIRAVALSRLHAPADCYLLLLGYILWTGQDAQR